FAIERFHFTPDEKTLIVCNPRLSPLIWDLKERKVVKDPSSIASDIVYESFIPNGRQWLWVSDVLSNPRQSTVRIAKLDNLETVRSFQIPHEVRDAALSADGKLLASLGPKVSDKDLRVIVWDVDTGRELGEVILVERDSEPASLLLEYSTLT